MRQSMLELAKAAGEIGDKASRELTQDPTKRISDWFSRVYRRGYLHGFFRALAYAKHHVKEGRLFRLRQIWKEAITYEVDALDRASVRHVVLFTPEAYNEFQRLLFLKHGVKLDAESNEDVSKTGKDGDAPVQGQTGEVDHEAGEVE